VRFPPANTFSRPISLSLNLFKRVAKQDDNKEKKMGLWQKSGTFKCDNLKEVAQELTLTCQGQAAAKGNQKRANPPRPSPSPAPAKREDPDGIPTPTLP
jgi:hypothetical protein